MNLNLQVEHLLQRLHRIEPLKVYGRVSEVVGLLIESQGPRSAIGDVCRIIPPGTSRSYLAEVVGFRGERVLSMALGDMQGIAPGSDIVATGEQLSIEVGDQLLGRVLDGLGNPIDGLGPVPQGQRRSIYAAPPDPLRRSRISRPITTGIRAIDAVTTLGLGQRVGIFSGSGVGKSTLLGMIARNTSADINVISLVGERGREVRDFIEKDLGEDGLRQSVLVVATSDQPALIRLKASLVATTIAEYFRDQGKNVMLMMDSLTRVAMALREIGLTVGEPPTTKGYTPSVFAFLPKLLERAGTSNSGSITGLYTVLVEGDDMNEPVADSARSILDGHLVLSRRLAAAGHYPAIDVLESISRVMNDVTTPEVRQAAVRLLDTLATYKEAEDLINIGAYVKGSNPKVDYAVRKIADMEDFLRQEVNDRSDYESSVLQLQQLMNNPAA
ncbi:MAG: flagellar protein export ATPase FliI [Calditrichia bacterium]